VSRSRAFRASSNLAWRRFLRSPVLAQEERRHLNGADVRAVAVVRPEVRAGALALLIGHAVPADQQVVDEEFVERAQPALLVTAAQVGMHAAVAVGEPRVEVVDDPSAFDRLRSGGFQEPVDSRFGRSQMRNARDARLVEHLSDHGRKTSGHRRLRPTGYASLIARRREAQLSRRGRSPGCARCCVGVDHQAMVRPASSHDVHAEAVHAVRSGCCMAMIDAISGRSRG